MKPQTHASQRLQQSFQALAGNWPTLQAPPGLAERTLQNCIAALELDALARFWPPAQAEPPAFRAPLPPPVDLLEQQYAALQARWPRSQAPKGLAVRLLRRIDPGRNSSASRIFQLFGTLAAAAVLLLTAVRGTQDAPALHELWSAELQAVETSPAESSGWEALQDLAELEAVESLAFGDERIATLSEAMEDLRSELASF